MSSVSKETIEHVAQLARIGVQGELLEQITEQLATILGYIEQLQGVETSGVPPTTHVLPLKNVLREDVVGPTLPQETVLSLAPAKQPPFITVPKVIES